MRSHLVPFLVRQRPWLDEHLGPDYELADVVDRRRMPEDGDPLRRPSEMPRDGLGQSRDPRPVALGVVALFEPADDRSEHVRRLFPGGARFPLETALDPA